MTSDELNEQIKRNKLENWPDLSDSQKMFGILYAETYVISSSATAAGVSPDRAQKWLREPLLIEFINEIQSHLNGRSVITKDFVNLQWLKLMPKLLGEEEVPLITSSGAIGLHKKFHASESVALLKELSKSTGFYIEGTDDEGKKKESTAVTFIIKSAKEVDGEPEIIKAEDA